MSFFEDHEQDPRSLDIFPGRQLLLLGHFARFLDSRRRYWQVAGELAARGRSLVLPPWRRRR